MIVARVFLTLLLALAPAAAQKPAEPAPAEPAKKPQQHAEPKEEDESALPRTYEFNPIQAENEIKVGRFYMKRGSFKAAAGRFDEASKWNPQSAEAFKLLGEAREKLKDPKAARAAYEKYLELAPEAKDAADIRRRIASLAPSKR